MRRNKRSIPDTRKYKKKNKISCHPKSHFSASKVNTLIRSLSVIIEPFLQIPVSIFWFCLKYIYIYTHFCLKNIHTGTHIFIFYI